jgi:hypothetical protein
MRLITQFMGAMEFRRALRFRLGEGGYFYDTTTKTLLKKYIYF